MSFDFENYEENVKKTLELLAKEHFKSMGKPLEEFNQQDFQDFIAKEEQM